MWIQLEEPTAFIFCFQQQNLFLYFFREWTLAQQSETNQFFVLSLLNMKLVALML